MKYSIIYSEKVLEKDFLTLPSTIRSRIRRAIDECLTIDPINLGKRLRVGNYRVIYKIAKLEYTVTITEIGHRDTIYKR